MEGQLDLNQLEIEQILEVYPNPAESTDQLTFNRILVQPTIQILSTEGKLISTEIFNSSISTISFPLLTKGNYILKIQEGEKIENLRLVII